MLTAVEVTMTEADHAIRDLTLMLLYLTSWREDPEDLRRAWKGYDFGTLDALAEQEMIIASGRSKSVHLTAEGERVAEGLLAKYGIKP